MNNLEKNVIKIVAKLSPWLAPLPSAYFVARSAMVHLALPLPVAAIVAAIIETLGLSTVHTALWAYDWNAHKRKTNPDAPLGLAVALGLVYVAATLGLVVFLEVWPFLATYAPAIFPAPAVVGAMNLALMSRQEQREANVKAQKAEAREHRLSRMAAQQVHREASVIGQLAAQESAQHAVLDVVNRTRRARKEALKIDLLAAYRDDPALGATEAARLLGVHRNTIYTYAAELEAAGYIDRSNGTVQVLERG